MVKRTSVMILAILFLCCLFGFMINVDDLQAKSVKRNNTYYRINDGWYRCHTSFGKSKISLNSKRIIIKKAKKLSSRNNCYRKCNFNLKISKRVKIYYRGGDEYQDWTLCKPSMKSLNSVIGPCPGMLWQIHIKAGKVDRIRYTS